MNKWQAISCVAPRNWENTENGLFWVAFHPYFFMFPRCFYLKIASFRLRSHTSFLTLLYTPVKEWRVSGKFLIFACCHWALQDVLFHSCFWTKTLNCVDDSSGEDIEWNVFTVVPSSQSPFQARLAFAITFAAGFVARFLHVSTTFIVCQ